MGFVYNLFYFYYKRLLVSVASPNNFVSFPLTCLSYSYAFYPDSLKQDTSYALSCMLGLLISGSAKTTSSENSFFYVVVYVPPPNEFFIILNGSSLVSKIIFLF